MNVYFIYDGNGHLKIGKSNDCYLRLKQLQTGCPYKLMIVREVNCESEADAFLVETMYHNMLRHLRISETGNEAGCEWFNVYWNDSFISDEKLKEYAKKQRMKE